MEEYNNNNESNNSENNESTINSTNVLLIGGFIFVVIIIAESAMIFMKAKVNNYIDENKTNTTIVVSDNNKAVDGESVNINSVQESVSNSVQINKSITRSQGATKDGISVSNSKTTNDYISSFVEDGTLIYDYDIKTAYNDINYKKAYELVIKESSRLKKKTDVNLFDYIGRVKKLGNYYYINYDVYLYNLPKNVYEGNKEQITNDKKNNKTSRCENDKCKMNITSGYKNISKYLVRKAYYYYVFDGTKKIQTTDILNLDYIKNNLPSDWLKLGNYKSTTAMVKDCLLMIDESHTYKNYLVIYDTGSELKFKYKGKSKTVLDKSNYSSEINKLYDKNAKVESNTSYLGVYKGFVYTGDESNKKYYSELYLREDGSYVYKYAGIAVSEMVGTYEVKDSTITFTEKVYYEHEGCYQDESSYFRTFSSEIKSNGSLEYTDISKKITMEKVSSTIEKNGIEDYVLNPTSKNWIKCTTNYYDEIMGSIIQ